MKEYYNIFTITKEGKEWVARLTHPTTIQKMAGVKICHEDKTRIVRLP